jgi:hypothetical protein
MDHEGVIAVAWVPVLALLSALAGQDQSRVEPKARVQTSAAATEKKSAAAATDKKPVATATGKKSAAAAKAPAHPTTPGNADVHVRSQAEMQKPKSPFLMPPGEAPADPSSTSLGTDGTATPDWNEIPPWRQASFFGVRARGQLFVYVVDCSQSMIDDDRLARATMELRRSVFALQTPQRFEVIFYNHESIPMPGGPISRPADPQSKAQLLYWLRLIEPDGGTDPRVALKQAVAMRPDAIFLLSDGAFPEGTVDMVTKLNTRKVPIHCVDLAGGLGGDHLRRIAQANGGRYASRPGDLQGRP